MTEIVAIEGDGPEAAREALERTIGDGGVVVFPADGLYGLGCDPLRADSIERLHAIKGRDDGKPSAVLYFNPLAMRELIAGIGPGARTAMAALLPGPVTLVIANPEHRYPLAAREDPGRLGVRLIEGPLLGMSLPLFQSSANKAGEPPPASFEEIDPEVLEAADLAIDGGELTGEASTVIDVTGLETGEEWEILRDGALTAAEVAARLDLD